MSLSAKRVERHYAAVQGTYWAANCSLRGLTAVFLSYHGLTDGQIGYTSSLIYFCTITLSPCYTGGAGVMLLCLRQYRIQFQM